MSTEENELDVSPVASGVRKSESIVEAQEKVPDVSPAEFSELLRQSQHEEAKEEPTEVTDSEEKDVKPDANVAEGLQEPPESKTTFQFVKNYLMAMMPTPSNMADLVSGPTVRSNFLLHLFYFHCYTVM